MSLENHYSGKRSKLKTVLVLAGGGFRASFECGVLKVLLKKIVPDVIIGTSAGSINAAAVALGMPLDEIEQHWRNVKKKEVFAFNPEILYKPFKIKSLYSNRSFKKWIRKIFHQNSFKDSKIPLYINTTRLKDGKEVFFSDGDLHKAILASCSIPPFLPPYKIDGVKYVDGGLSDFLGAEEVIKLGCEQAIILTTGYSSKQEHQDRNVFDLMRHTVELVNFQAMHKEFELCELESRHKNIVEINPKNKHNARLDDTSQIPKMILEGEKEARKNLKKIII